LRSLARQRRLCSIRSGSVHASHSASVIGSSGLMPAAWTWSQLGHLINFPPRASGKWKLFLQPAQTRGIVTVTSMMAGKVGYNQLWQRQSPQEVLQVVRRWEQL
jgi:hypothetical protein